MSAQHSGRLVLPASGSTVLAAVLVCGMWLAACQRSESVPPVAGTPANGMASTTAVAGLPAVPASGADNSVPDAGRVLAGEGAASAPGSGEPSVNQRSTVTAEQESKAMPLPGQANDHSNTAGEKASAPTPR
jgi:hypothetical protein